MGGTWVVMCGCKQLSRVILNSVGGDVFTFCSNHRNI